MKNLKTVILENVGESLSLAIIYTLGHILIAICVLRFVTGTNWYDAGLVALIEPCINGIWFYVLHKLWRTYEQKRL